jgi:glutamine amidotransferase
VHSYHIVCERADDVVTTTEYGYAFVSALERDNIFGAQFHPEKSHKFGMRVLKNFVER